ncbi:MAG: hypothetical protein ACAI44_39735 [Candidatus Sericytochromatia bacterium]
MKKAFLQGVLLQGRIQATALQVPDELDDLPALIHQLQREQRMYCTAPRHEVMAAIRRGEVRHTRLLNRQVGCNRVVRGFYLDFFARLMGSQTTPGANQTLFIEYFALGTGYVATSASDTQLGNEIYRAVPDELYEDGVSTFYATTYLKKAQGNPTGNTTVSSSTSTVITVASATGFTVNCRIQVETALNTYNCTVSAIAGSNLTVTAITGGSLSNASAFDAGDIPALGDTVKALHAEAGCFMGGAATSSPNTGTLMNRKRIEQLKDSSVSLLYDYILACTSLE